LQMLSPARWIIAGSIVVNGGPSEHGLDPAAHARGRLRPLLPDRLDHLEHERRVDRGDGQVAQCRKQEPDERSFPILPVLRMRPFLFIVANVAFCALLECHRAGGGDEGSAALCALVGDWVDVVETELTSRTRALASLRQREQAKRAETHVSVVAV